MNTTEPKPEKVLSTSDSTHAFAVPGASNFIDCIHPVTGLSWWDGHNLEEIQARYPGAQIVEISQWCKELGARQDSPVEWSETTEEQYWEMLEAVPPACMLAGSFLVGEPWDHHAVSGLPRFHAYLKRGNEYLASNRPLTIPEFKSIVTALFNHSKP